MAEQLPRSSSTDPAYEVVVQKKHEASSDKKKASPEELRSRLEARSTLLTSRIDALQEELRGVPSDVKRTLRNHPLVTVGGSLVLGLLTGLVIGGAFRSKEKKRARSHKSAVRASQHLDEMASELTRLLRKGETVRDAVNRVVGKHTPVIVVQHGEAHSEGGFVRQVMRTALNTGLAFASKALMDQVVQGIGLADGHNDATDESSDITVVGATADDNQRPPATEP